MAAPASYKAGEQTCRLTIGRLTTVLFIKIMKRERVEQSAWPSILDDQARTLSHDQPRFKR